MKKGMELIYDIRPEYISDFHVTPEFMEVFGLTGELSSEDEERLKWRTSDRRDRSSLTEPPISTLFFENMLVTEDGVYALDYEWVFLFPVRPVLCVTEHSIIFTDSIRA